MGYRIRASAARTLLRLGRLRAWRWVLGALQIVFGAGSRRRLQLSPGPQLEPIPGDPGGWRSLGTDPHFVTRDLYMRIPKGWCHLDVGLSAEEDSRAAVYIDTGRGFLPHGAIEVPLDPIDGASCRLRLPASTRALRLDPVDAPGEFQLGSAVIVQVSAGVQAIEALRALRRRSRRVLGPTVRTLRSAGSVAIVRPARAVGRLLGALAMACFQRSTPRSLTLEPDRQLAPIPSSVDRWHSLGRDPRFRLTGDSLPHGWCDFATVMSSGSAAAEPRLYAEVHGRVQQLIVSSTWRPDSDRVGGRAYVPIAAKRLWWAPVRRPGEFHQDPSLVLRPLGLQDQLRRRSAHRVEQTAQEARAPINT